MEALDNVLAAVSAVLKVPLTPATLGMVQARFVPERVTFSFNGRSGYLSSRDAASWNISLGDIRKAIGNAQVGRAVAGEDVSAVKRMMGIGPSLMEQVSGIGEAAEEFFVYRVGRKDPALDDSKGVMGLGGYGHLKVTERPKLAAFNSKLPAGGKHDRKLVWQGRAKAQHGHSASTIALQMAANAVRKSND